MSDKGKFGIGIPCFSASNAAKLADSANDIQTMLATTWSTVAMANHFIEKRVIA